MIKTRRHVIAWLAFSLLGFGHGPALAEATTIEDVKASLPKLEAYVEKLIQENEVPGLAFAIVFDDRVIHAKGFGVRVAGDPAVVDADTVFQIASLSKPVSSSVVAALVSEGAVEWDSRIADIDPTFRLHEPYPSSFVTVADLFAHHSGLPGIAGNELEALGFDRDEILHRLRLVQPLNSFRGGYSYSNFGLTAGAVAAAKAADLSWDVAADKMLFEPLGMHSSSMRLADFLAHENRAELHVLYDGTWQPLAKRDPDPQAPAGGVSSSANDLAQWMRLELSSGMFDGEQLIAQDAIAQTHVPVTAHGNHPVSGLPSFYALGWNVRYGPQGPIWGHAGAFSAGARTVVQLHPDENLGIVVLANAFPTGVPEAVADTFADLVFKGISSDDWLGKWNGLYGSMFGPVIDSAKEAFGTIPEPQSPSLELSAYEGTYSNDYIGEALIENENGALKLRLGPGGMTSIPLRHFDRDIFTYFPYDEMPDTPYAISFQIGPDGMAASIVIDDLNDLGLGTLSRISD